MQLTDAGIKAAIYAGKTQKLRDGNGLYLHVMPSGKYWRYDYRYQGRRKTLALGVFPAVTLKSARIALFEAKGKLEQGIDPSYEKRVAKYISTDHTFKAVSSEWLEQHDCTDRSRNDIRLRYKKDAYPLIGNIPVQQIRPTDVLAVLRRIESRDAHDLARRVCTHISQAMRYAVYTGLIPSDPCRDLKGALRRKRATKRYPAITTEKEFGRLLVDIDKYSSSMVIAFCLQLAAHVALRPTELRAGLWTEIKWQDEVWEIPLERMKKDRDHVVPLSRQSLDILSGLHRITGRSIYMFPSPVKPNQPISGGSLGGALRKAGYDAVHCPHGFRSSFSTMANESGLFSPDAIEAQLSHLDSSRVRAAYNRAEHLEQRRKLMQWWSDRISIMRQTARDREDTD
ncbi:integrase arm-type DNA-binding domain-containing protein [uncultured Paraglaciecola sp.]|uniref:tyrosine-type recombinase/integrase n=1 Tax=uncultured Paraglaciecola sp. TaxID=1765024 RepID=UPI002610E927|nr:integrase arm-type DNA-binding domain-containing protein [uncultured Paraglaciecola sp.]